MTNEELDKWIWEWIYGERWDFDAGCIPAPYSSKVDAAFEVVEKMREMGYWMRLDMDSAGTFGGSFGKGYELQWCAAADTPSMAICLAAKKAIEEVE